MTEDIKMPEKKFRAGQVTATIWKNMQKRKDGGEFEKLTTCLEKNYGVEENGKTVWKKTSSLDSQDIPKAILVLNKAFEFINLKEETNE